MESMKTYSNKMWIFNETIYSNRSSNHRFIFFFISSFKIIFIKIKNYLLFNIRVKICSINKILNVKVNI